MIKANVILDDYKWKYKIKKIVIDNKNKPNNIIKFVKKNFKKKKYFKRKKAK